MAQDVSGLRQTRAGIRTFLAQQDSNWSGTEPFEGRTRPDTFTFHNREGRGAVWRDHDRGVLWLCCTSDHHDAGYAHGHALAEADELYPDLDPSYIAGQGATAEWGRHADEDALESLRLLGQASQTFDGYDPAEHPNASYDNGVGFIRLSVEDDIWTLTIRRSLVYPEAGAARDRWLSDEELARVFEQLTGLSADEAEWWAPPYDAFHVNIHFLGGVLPPDEWLDRRIEAVIDEAEDQALRV